MKKFLFLFIIACCLYSSASAQFVSAGEYFSVAKCSPCDNAFSWGANWDGELGDSTFADRSAPGVVHNLNGITAISAGAYFTLAIRADSTVWGWGPNWDGNLGDGTYIDRLEPVKTLTLTGVKAISAGGHHSLALKSDGTVWAWGYNGYGELGDSTTITRISPVKVKGLSDIIAISAGEYHSLAVKSDGTVWSWGRNSNGQLGDSTILQRIYRVQVRDLAGITKISAGYDFSLALKSDGTLWSWGRNSSGQLGDGSTLQKIYRVQVSVLVNTVVAMEGGQDFALAIKNDGTVWAWGYNGYGQLGDNTYTQRNAPVQTLGGMSNVISISAGGYHSLAMKSDGSVWGWGYNYDGQTGNGINSNEYLLPQRTLYLCPGIDNDIDIDLPASCTQYDTLAAGGNISESFTVHNFGCDTLLITNVTSTSGNFTVSSYPAVIAPLDSAQLDISFIPASPGSYTTTITVFNNDADTTFCLHGVATPAPTVTVTPSSFTATVTCGDSVINVLTIGNTGAGNLNYSVSPCNFNASLSSVLTKLNSNFTTVNSVIPSRYDFTDGITGNSISDGGGDMYDGGNFLNTNLGANLAYSDNLVISSAAMGSGGKYFTRKYQGLWVFGADVNNLTYFEITGNLGADGSGIADNTILTTTRCATTYKGFVKRVYNAGDPSVNHLIIVENKTGLSHTASSNTNEDQHRLSGLSTTTRIYYLLYAHTGGGYIDNATTLNIMNKFLDAINQFPTWLSAGPPTTGTVAPAGTNTVSVEFDGSGLLVGQYISSVNVNSNDPLNPSVAIPCTLNVVGTPNLNVSVYDLTPPCVDFDSIMANTTSRDSILLTNVGCDTLRIDSLKISPAIYSIISSPAKVAPGESKKIIMQFAPVAAGTFAGTLNIYTNELDTALCLQGKAFPRPIISTIPTSLSTTLACTSTSTTTITINNTGGTNLTYGISIGNPNPVAASCSPTAGAKNNCCLMGIYNVTFNSINNTTLATDGRYNDYTSSQSTILTPGQTYTLSVQTGSNNNEYVEAWIDYNNNGIFEGTELVMNVLNALPTQTHTVSVTVPVSAVQIQPLRMRIASDYDGSPVPTPCSNAVYGQTEDYTIRILNWLTLSATTGTVTPSSSNTIAVTFNSANLTAGTYTANISISNNDPLNNPLSIPTSLTVVGTPNLNVSVYDLTPPCVDFDSIMAYTTSRDSILLTNAGCDTIRIDSLKISPSLFTILSSQVKVAPGDSRKIVMQFAPVAAGTFAGTLNIYTNELDTALCLQGKAFPRPIITTIPTSLSSTLNCTDSSTSIVTINNTGGNNLTYNVSILNPTFGTTLPIAASCTPTIGAKNNCCDMGIYNVKFNSINNTTLATDGRYNDYTGSQKTIVIPGQTYTLSVQTGISYSEYVEAWIDYNNNGIFEGSELVMNILNTLPNQTHTVSVTIPLSAAKNKLVRMRVSSDYNGSPIPTPCSNAVYGQTEDYTVSILKWATLTSASTGTITPSSSNTIAVTFNSTDLTAGTYTANVSISNNDPLNNPLSIPATLTVVGVSDARFALMDTVPTLCLDLDSIMEYTTSLDSVRIVNIGCDTLDIDSLKITPAVFTIISSPAYVIPGATKYVAVKFSPLSAATFSGTLTVYTNDADTVICLKGKSFLKPVQCHNPNSFAPHFLVCQDSLLDTLEICNTGLGNLNYSLWSPYGRSASFDGSGDFISTPLNIDQSAASPGLTMSAWVYPTSAAGGYHHVISTDNGGYDWSMLKIGALWYIFTGENVRSTGFAVTVNQWQHIAAVFIPGFGVKFYKNGVLANIPFIDYESTDGNVNIGRNPGFGEYFDGKIDEARVYNKQLTQAEIVATMRGSLTGTETALQGYWHFDDSTATDFSPNTNNGTLGGNAFITIPNVQFLPAPTGTVSPSGTYTVQVKFKKVGLPSGTTIVPIYLNSNDPLNALDTINATFDIDAVPPAPTAGSNAPICAGNNLSLTASTITGATYAWTGPNSFTSALQNPVITTATTAAAGTYSVTAAVSGCPPGAAGTTTVIINSPPATPIAGSNSPVCTGQTLSLTANTIAGATYSWTGPGFTSALQNPTITSITTAATGTYSVTATVPGCPTTSAGTTTVIINITPVAPTASSNSPVCVGNDLSLTASTITGVTYAWTGPNTFSSATQNPVITAATVAASGTYSVTATENGCTGPIGTTSVIVNSQPGAPIAGSNSTVCSGFTLSLTANTTAGATYAWSGPNSFSAATQNPTIPSVTTLAAGTYSVTATVGGCPTSPVGTTTVAINQTPIAPTAGSNSPVCVGNNLSLTASTITGVTYAWTGPNSFSSALQDPAIVGATTAASGTYSVTATIGGCTGPRGTTTVTVNPAPGAPVAGSNSTVCSGQTLSLTANTISGATYAWTGPNSFSAGSQNPTIAGVTTLAAGTYSVTATVGGCPTSPVGTTTVAINESPAAPVTSSNSPVCSGQTLSLTASTVTGATYTWSGPLGYSSGLQNPTIAGVPTTRAGTYSAFAIVGGCPSPAGTTSVTIYQTPSAPTAGSNSPVCVGFTISLTANTISGAIYAWTGPNSFSDASQNPTISSAGTINSGSYSVTVTENGCTGAVGTTSVTVNNAPSTPSAGSNSPVCSGQTLSLSATNVTGATYSWTGPNSLTSSSQNPTIAGVNTAASGTYSVSAVVGGCPPSAPGTVVVIINQTPSAPIAGSNTPVCVGSTLSLTASTISGATYSWTGPNSFTDATQDPTISSVGTVNAGTYSVSATVNGCTGPIGPTSVVVNVPPSAPTAGSNSTICSGQTLSLTASTVTGATYSWTGPNSFTSALQNPTISNATTAANGTYSVTATKGGCPPSAAGTTVATINQTPSAPVASSNSPVCAGFTLSLTASTSGTTYSWNGPAGFISSAQNPTITNVTSANAGTYSVSATDAGCTGPKGTTVVTVNPIPSAPTATNKNGCFGGTIPALTATGTNIQWYDNLGGLVFSGSPFATGQTTVGTYTYSATQTVNGCTSPSATVTLTINALPSTPAASSDAVICYGDPAPNFTATGSNLTWYNNTGGAIGTGNPFTPTQTSPGVYTYYVTQTSTVTTCESLKDSVQFTINSIAPPIAPDVASCAGNPVPPLTATGTSVQWYDVTMTPVFSGNSFNTGQTAIGTYTYYVTQTNTVTTCSSPKDTVLLIISTQPTVAPVVPDAAGCFGSTIPNLTATSGSIINWYSDAALSNQVYSGNPFTTGLTAAGSYTFFATDSTPGCPEGPSDSAILLINALPASLSVNDTASCFGIPAPALITSGTDIQWYNSSSVIVSTNDTFLTSQTAVGTYTYYVTQSNTSTGCESMRDTVHLTINTLPVKPLALDTAVCSSALIPNLISTGNNVQWYDTTGAFLFTGNTYATGQTTTGVYAYLVTQKDVATGCESVPDTSILAILFSPPIPIANNVAVCIGNPIPALTTTGVNPHWYSNAALTTLVNTGNTYNTGQTAVGVYTYYVKDTLSGCTSSASDSVTLSINTLPGKPTAANATICYGDASTLTATGTNPQWYTDATLINMVGTGSPFNTGLTGVGTYTYYVTDFAAGCGNSASDTAVISINPTPLITANTYTTTIVQSASTPLTAYNAVSYSWAPTAGLSATTGQTVIASPTTTTTYTVTGTNLYGCTNSITIHIIVNPLGVVSYAEPVQDVAIYPNPAVGGFTLEFNTTLETPIDIYMLNMLGEKVRVVRGESGNGRGLMQHKYKFDTSTLTEGVYHVEIITEQGKVNRRVVLFR